MEGWSGTKHKKSSCWYRYWCIYIDFDLVVWYIAWENTRMIVINKLICQLALSTTSEWELQVSHTNTPTPTNQPSHAHIPQLISSATYFYSVFTWIHTATSDTLTFSLTHLSLFYSILFYLNDGRRIEPKFPIEGSSQKRLVRNASVRRSMRVSLFGAH